MTTVCIGIHVHSDPERLHATLESIRTNTEESINLLLLPDGPDESLRRTLASMTDIAQSASRRALGAPACFNRLVTASDADVLILLESGSLVGPGWLGQLLTALQADPSHGLAGPTTNRSWNEQGAYPHARGSLIEVKRTARVVLQRFGRTWRTLEPLYSLADFCYAVRKEVVENIGAADETYGLGSCWEMDYNIRAARAGFKGVWARAAYVYRSPMTARRQHHETLLFTASKNRYQDKFCGMQIREGGRTYRSHCRGAACEYFAPSDMIQIHLPLSSPQEEQPDAEQPVPDIDITDKLPLVSCIMPTGKRHDYVQQAIHYFQRQDYAARELILIDDSETNQVLDFAGDRIRVIQVPPGLSIGAKRNLACENARGDIIAHWDDDDWYAPDRLSCQIAPLLAETADITGFNGTIFFDLHHWQFWTCTPRLHSRLFVHDVHGGTLVYWRRVWLGMARYPDQSLAEDAVFLRLAVRRGARLTRLPNERQFIYLRHQSNSWRFTCGHYLDPGGWRAIPEPDHLTRDRTFYVSHAGREPVIPLGTSLSEDAQPLVSCILPTADRRYFLPQALRYFQHQDYDRRELIVLDDGADSVADIIPDDPRIRYERLPRKLSIGEKHNLGCEMSKGPIIAHWDDDDWVAPWRLTYQVRALKQRPDIALCGLSTLLYYRPKTGEGWQYTHPARKRPWLGGATFCYRRELWQQHPHPQISEGDDTQYISQLRPQHILPLENYNFLVAIIHEGNTSFKRTSPPRWQICPVGDLKELMGSDWQFYAALRAQPSH